MNGRKVQIIEAGRYPIAAKIKPGDRILVKDAWGKWHERVATSELEGTHEIIYDGHRARKRKIHDFPVVWAKRPDGEGPGIPWPAEDVKLP